MKKQKTGLWAIVKPIRFEIRASMLLASIGATGLIANLVIISFTLSCIAKSEAIVVFGYEMEILNTILLIVFLTIVTFSSRLSAFAISHLGALKLEQIIRTDLSEHLAKVPLGYIISNGSGALKKVLLDDVKNLHAFVADSTPIISKSITSSVLSLLVLIYVDYRLALVCVFIMIIGVAIMSIIMRDSVSLRKNYEKSQSNINKAVIEFTQAMPVVRTFDSGSQSFKRYHSALFDYRKNLLDWISKTRNFAKLGKIILSPLPTILVVLFVGLLLLDRGSIELSSLIIALFLSTGMSDSLMPLMWTSEFIRKSNASALKIQEVLAVDKLKESTNPKIPKENSIVFENVNFSYDGQTTILHNINFEVKQGGTVALVGPSGAGKSTIAKLIPRFWDIDSGSIKIGDVDIRDIGFKELMGRVSFIFQDTFLFHDSLLNNIKLANPKASYDDVVRATKAAQIHDFIISLPDGYETKVGDRGASLSGGQKQRVTIARAILRDAPILILDEATSFADPQNEESILKALRNLMKGKTIIVIAHKLSTIKNADKIIVFRDGKISESGKHQELLSNKSTYSTLWNKYIEAQKWSYYE